MYKTSRTFARYECTGALVVTVAAIPKTKIVFNVSVCLYMYVSVNIPKSGSGDVSCSVLCMVASFLTGFVLLSRQVMLPRYHDSVATVEDADMKHVVGTKVQMDLEDGFGMTVGWNVSLES